MMFAVAVEDVMDAVAGDRPLDLAAVAKIDRDPRCRPYRLPVQDVVFAKIFGYLRFG